MKRVGMAYRKTASIPGGADPQMQLVFLQEELIPRLEEAREGTRRGFFVDAAHFVLGAFLGMIRRLTRVLVRTEKLVMMIEAMSSRGRRFSPSAVLQVNCPSRQLREACGESMVTMWKLTKNAEWFSRRARDFQAGRGIPCRCLRAISRDHRRGFSR